MVSVTAKTVTGLPAKSRCGSFSDKNGLMVIERSFHIVLPLTVYKPCT
jgi:hypothetical protein